MIPWLRVPLLFLALIAGCSFAGAAESVVNSCASEEDCAAAGVCSTEVGICISERRAGYQVVLRVNAPSDDTGTRMPPLRFPPFELGGPVVERDLALPSPVKILGAVAKKSPGRRSEPLAAELLWTPVGLGPGPEPETLSVTSSLSTLVGAPGSTPPNFTVALLPDTDYRVSVRPLSDAVALVPPRELSVSRDLIASGFIEISYEDMEEVRGRLVTEESKAQAGLSVRAVDPATGRVVSSRGLTDESGGFVLFAEARDDGEPPWLFEVGPSAGNAWFGAVQSDQGDVRLLADGRLLITLPALPDLVRVEGWVEQAESLERVGDASLVFSGTVMLTRADGGEVPAQVTQLTRSGLDGTLGRFDTQLWPGEYDVVVVPPPASDRLAPVLQTGFQVADQERGGSQSGSTFGLGRRSLYRGTVRDARGQALPNVAVRLVPSQVKDFVPKVAEYSRSTSAVTGKDGDFRLPADIGTFDMVVEPEETGGYAWRLLPNQHVAEHGQTRDVDVELASPVVVQGTVSFAAGQLPEGTWISAFAAVSAGPDGTEPRYVQIGRANVAAEGSYQLYLPPSVQ